MKIKDQLLSAGFKPFSSVFAADKDCYEESYQLKVVDDKGIKYFINIDLYDYNQADWQHNIPTPLLDDLQGVYEVQFHLEEGNVFNVELTQDNVEKAVAFFAKVFYSMDCSYYDEY